MQTESRNRVLHLIANLDVGGAQEVVRSLVPHLPDAGWTAVVGTFRDGPLGDAIRASGTEVHVLGARRHGILSFRGINEIVGIRRRLSDLCADRRISVVQTHLLRSLDFIALSLRTDPGVCGVFWTVHNSRLDLRPDQLPDHPWLLQPKRLAYRWSYRVGSRLGGHFIAVSQDVGAAIRTQLRPARDRVHVIPNGVDVDRYPTPAPRADVRRTLGIDERSTVLICVAKLHEQKGHRDLFAALPKVVERHPDLTLLLVGDGPLREPLEALARTMGLAGRVRFLGTRHDVPELLAAADLFVLASHWEGLPMALLEAMAGGLPSVVTDVSGTREVSVPGRTALIVPVGRPDRLAEGILAALVEPRVAIAMGLNARAHVVAEHSVRVQALRHAALYASAVTATANAVQRSSDALEALP